MTPGIYLRGQVDYDAIDAANYSTIKELARSPKHYQHRLQRGFASTRSMDKGTAAHIAMLEPERFVREYAIYDGDRRGAKWADFKSANMGRSILTAKEFDQAIAMRDAVRGDPIAGPYLAAGVHEATLVWRDAITGLMCKGRPDFIRKDNVIVDIKTTKDPSPMWFGRDCARLQYHVQAAMYLDALEQITKRECSYVIIAVEAVPPYDVVVYRLDERVIGPGRDAYHNMLRTLAECRSFNRWPGYSGGLELALELPAWAVESDDDLEALGLE